MTTEARVRLSRGSGLRQTSQWQPIIGTPALVPVPRKRSSTSPISGGYTGGDREAGTRRLETRPLERAARPADATRHVDANDAERLHVIQGPQGHRWGGRETDRNSSEAAGEG